MSFEPLFRDCFPTLVCCNVVSLQNQCEVVTGLGFHFLNGKRLLKVNKAFAKGVGWTWHSIDTLDHIVVSRLSRRVDTV